MIINELNSTKNQFTESSFQDLLEGKIEYMVIDDGFQGLFSAFILEEAQKLWQDGSYFKDAGVGKNQSF